MKGHVGRYGFERCGEFIIAVDRPPGIPSPGWPHLRQSVIVMAQSTLTNDPYLTVSIG